MDIDEFRAEVERMTYKPGFRLDVTEALWPVDKTLQGPLWMFIVAGIVYDAQGESRDVLWYETIDSLRLEKQISRCGTKKWVAGALSEMELHEAAEWLCYDGEHVVEPHDDGGYPNFLRPSNMRSEAQDG